MSAQDSGDSLLSRHAAPPMGRDPHPPRRPARPSERLAGFLLLPAGWIIVLSAIILLPGAGARATFVLAGIAIQIIGLALVFRSQRPAPLAPRRERSA